MEPANYPFVLRERLGSQGVASLADILATERTETMTVVTNTFERRLSDECGKIRADLRAEVSALRSDLGTEMKALRTELRSDFKVEVANVRAVLLKWSFVFWMGQVAAVLGFVTVLR